MPPENTIYGFVFQTFIGTILIALGFIALTSFVWRTILLRVKKNCPEGKGWLVKVAQAVKGPGHAVFILVGVHIFLSYSPTFGAKESWILAVRLLTSFSGVILVGESLFSFVIDFYLKERRGTGIPSIFQQLLKGIAYLIVGLSFLSTTYKIDVTPLLTTSAVFTMVIGLALQDVLGNLFAGISVHISPPFKLGDWIEIDKFFGKVIESHWRATTLRSPNKELIIIPNNDISRKDVINHSHIDGVLKRDFILGLSYQTSPDQARRNLLAACEQVKGILSYPRPEVFMELFQDFSITYRVRYWISENGEQLRICDQLASRIWYRLKREGLVIPFPIRDIYLHPEKDLDDLHLNRKIALITEIDFLNSLQRKQLVFIAQHLKEAWYEDGEVIVRKGENGTDFFIIDQGQVSVFLDGSSRSRVAVLSEGAFFGEMSLLTGEPRSATIYADTETKILVLRQEVVSELLNEEPDLAQTLSQVISARHAQNVEVREKEKREYPLPTPSVPVKETQASILLLQKIKSFFRIN